MNRFLFENDEIMNTNPLGTCPLNPGNVFGLTFSGCGPFGFGGGSDMATANCNEQNRFQYIRFLS